MSIQCCGLDGDTMAKVNDVLQIFYSHLHDPEKVIRVSYTVGGHLARVEINNKNYVGVDASFLKYYNHCKDICYLSMDKIVLIQVKKN